MIKVNMNIWRSKTEAAKKRVQQSANKHVQAVALRVVHDAMKVSPQWSGNYAFNWQLQFGPMAGTSYQKTFKVEPFYLLRPNEKQVGHPTAIQAGMRRERELVKDLKWNHKLKLVNLAPVAAIIDSGLIRLRPENLVDGSTAITEYLKAKYRFVS